ncbi:MAG: alkaline phosphatase D family protein [Bryobacteraceae bacterium]|nr:alkaline phosphatase D family protein [Bryobacteraceae bacterium]
MRYWAFLLPAFALAQGPYIAEGLRVGEVTDRSAAVRFRLSQMPAPNKGKYQPPRYEGTRPPALPETEDPWLLPGGVPGLAGRARLWVGTRPDLKDAKPAEWLQSAAKDDFVLKTSIPGLRAGRTYYVGVEIHSKPEKAAASFTTAPEAGRRAPVKFTAASCFSWLALDHDEGFDIFPSMEKFGPNFAVFLGDNVYYDTDPPRATTTEAARYHWQRLWALPRPLAFLAKTPAYWMKDDHDTLCDDCWPGRDPDWMKPMTFAEGQRIFLEQTPIEGRTYRTFRWGKSLQIWLLEGRDYRSPNTDPDGPSKTILGAEQKAWLKKTVEESDADWKIIFSPTAWVGPDQPANNDNHANAAFSTEGKELRSWAGSRKNVVVICGDRHWQYHSVDPETGLHEFSTGPAADRSALGSPGEDKRYHRFHRVAGGFLSVSVEPLASGSRLVFRHHDTKGAVVYEFTLGG